MLQHLLIGQHDYHLVVKYSEYHPCTHLQGFKWTPKFIPPAQTETFPLNPKTCISSHLVNISTWIHKGYYELKISRFFPPNLLIQSSPIQVMATLSFQLLWPQVLVCLLNSSLSHPTGKLSANAVSSTFKCISHFSLPPQLILSTIISHLDRCSSSCLSVSTNAISSYC